MMRKRSQISRQPSVGCLHWINYISIVIVWLYYFLSFITKPPQAQAASYYTYLGNTYELDAGCVTSGSNDNFVVLYHFKYKMSLKEIELFFVYTRQKTKA